MHKLHFSAPLKRWVVLTTFAALSSIVKLATGRCSSPQTPDHSYLIYERHSNPPAYLPNGYAVRVVCEDRFKLEGEGNGFMICSRDGEWTNSASCTAICERLPCFQNGEITYSSGASIASYSCTVPGYRLKGNGTRSCMSDGTWSGKIPRCRGNPRCEQPEIGHLIHRRLAGRKTGELWVVGTIFQFSCEGQLGYPSDRFPAIKCTSRGWNSTVPDCSGIPKCEQPQLDQNIIQRRFSGVKLGDLWTIGTILQFSCKDPSQLVSDHNLAIECTSGNWNSSVPVCRDTKCSPPLENIDHGNWLAENRLYDPGEVIEFTCDRGYKSSGSSSPKQVCVLNTQTDGSSLPMWDGETPRCEETQCPPPGDIEYGETVVSSTSVDGKTTFRCQPGFVIVGSDVISCQENGQWSGTIPSCYKNISPFVNEFGVDIYFLLDASNIVDMGYFELSKRFAKSLVRQTGVTRSSNSLRVAAAYFSYLPEIAFLTNDFRTTNEVIDAINWIQFTGGGRNINEALILVKEVMVASSQHREGVFKAIFLITDDSACVHGFSGDAASELESLGLTIYCVAVKEHIIDRDLYELTSPLRPEHIFFLSDYGSISRLVTEIFYKPETKCPRPGKIENGETIVSSTSVNGTTTFRCHPGFVIVGNDVISCQEDGQWSGRIPSCYQNLSPFNNKIGADIYFLFDASNSVGMNHFQVSKRFAVSLVRQIGVTSSANSLRVGAAFFSYLPEIAFLPLSFRATNEVISAINHIQFTGGGTDINEALILMKEVMIPIGLGRKGAFKAIFLITDGDAYVHNTSRHVASNLKSLGIKIYCVAIKGNSISRDLRELTSKPHTEHAFVLSDYGSIKRLVPEIIYKSVECGVSENTAPRGRVVGGNDARPGAWPWQVLLEMQKRLQKIRCGGVLIDSFWVLTVANCIPSDPEYSMTAILGRTDLHHYRPGQEISVEEVIPHPEYDANTFRNNIALVKLRRPAVLNINVSLVCLPDKAKADRILHSGPFKVRVAVVTGWGYTKAMSVNGIAGEFPNTLQQLALPLKSREECRASLIGTPEEDFFDESMFCAGYANAVRGSCAGDSGGPLVRKMLRNRHRRWTLIGLNSWGRGCALRNEFDFFTNVFYFLDWIKETMQQN